MPRYAARGPVTRCGSQRRTCSTISSSEIEVVRPPPYAWSTHSVILRTASDYTVPPPGMTASDYVAATQKNIPATREALSAAFVIGNPVVTEITGNWARYENAVPGR